MTPQSEQILRIALDLSSIDRAELVEQILASLESPSRTDIDAAWGKEAEDRIDASERGEIESSPASKVFQEIDQQAGCNSTP